MLGLFLANNLKNPKLRFQIFKIKIRIESK